MGGGDPMHHAVREVRDIGGPVRDGELHNLRRDKTFAAEASQGREKSELSIEGCFVSEIGRFTCAIPHRETLIRFVGGVSAPLRPGLPALHPANTGSTPL